MHRIWLRPWVTVAITATLVGIGLAARRPGAPAGSSREVRLAFLEDGWRDRADVPGVVLAVEDRDGSRWLRASGTTLRGGGSTLPADARFRIGSITKTFVAVVVVQLAGEHRLNLDAPASRYLPGRPAWDGVTVRELLNHTSGIPDYAAMDERFTANLVRDRARRWTADELLALAHAVRPNFPAGTDYQYSNTDYVLLGRVVEAVTGTSWAAQVRLRILDPLHLDATYVDGAEPGPPVTAGYFDGDNDGQEENTETGTEWTSLASSEGPAGAIVSTAADLTTFADALFHGRLVGKAQLRAMTADGPFHPRGTNYGLGVEITRTDRTMTVWGHGGFVPGFRSTLWYSPRHDTTVVALANDSRANTADLAELAMRSAAPSSAPPR